MVQDGAGTPRVILVEDDEAVRRSLQLLLRWHGYEVRAFSSAESASQAGDLDRVRWLIADYRLSDGDGLGVLETLQRRGWKGRSLLVTGHFEATLASRALAAGFDAIIQKPLSTTEVLSALL